MTSKLLLVENNNFFRKTVRSVIRSRFSGLEIEEAADAQAAREQVTVFRPDVIFMDIRLPDGDGVRLAKSIKSEFPGTVVVMLTNLDSREYRNACFEAGADGFISKRDALLDAIVAVMDRFAKEGLRTTHPARLQT